MAMNSNHNDDAAYLSWVARLNRSSDPDAEGIDLNVDVRVCEHGIGIAINHPALPLELCGFKMTSGGEASELADLIRRGAGNAHKIIGGKINGFCFLAAKVLLEGANARRMRAILRENPSCGCCEVYVRRKTANVRKNKRGS